MVRPNPLHVDVGSLVNEISRIKERALPIDSRRVRNRIKQTDVKIIPTQQGISSTARL